MPLRFYDPRSQPLDRTPTGVNGFLMAPIAGEALTLEYRDIKDASLFVEAVRSGAGGSLTYCCRSSENIVFSAFRRRRGGPATSSAPKGDHPSIISPRTFQ
jgi:hypothetical protein